MRALAALALLLALAACGKGQVTQALCAADAVGQPIAVDLAPSVGPAGVTVASIDEAVVSVTGEFCA